jgi:hypothetical protein
MNTPENYWMNRCDTEPADVVVQPARKTHDTEDELFAVALAAGWVIAVIVCWFKSQPLDGGSWWMFGAGVAFFTFFVNAAWWDVQRHAAQPVVFEEYKG